MHHPNASYCLKCMRLKNGEQDKNIKTKVLCNFMSASAEEFSFNTLLINWCANLTLEVTCSGACSTSSSFSSSQPGCSQGCFHSIFLTLPGRTLPLLKSVFPDAPPASLRGWAVSCGGGVGELAVSGTKEPQPLLTEAPAASSWAQTPKIVT